MVVSGVRVGALLRLFGCRVSCRLFFRFFDQLLMLVEEVLMILDERRVRARFVRFGFGVGPSPGCLGKRLLGLQQQHVIEGHVCFYV